MSDNFDVFLNRAEILTYQIERLLPWYHPDAADVNEGLDTGWASCAARAFTIAAALRDSFPDRNVYRLSVGYDPEHGEDMVTSSGEKILKMGHVVAGAFVFNERALIIDSFDDGTYQIQSGVKRAYKEYRHIWDTDKPIEDTYHDYLTEAGMDDIAIDLNDIVQLVLRQAEQ